MEEKKEIKINLGIMIFIIILIVLLLAIGIILYLNKDNDEKMKAKDLKVQKYNFTTNENIAENPTGNDVIIGHDWQASEDKSLLCLAENGTFLWYRDSDDKSNNYYEGTYKVYSGEDAINYIAEDLSKYGITKDEQLDIIERNKEYKLNNYYCLVLNNEKCIVDGENILAKTTITPYYGFYYESDKYLDFANMNTANYIRLIKVN